MLRFGAVTIINQIIARYDHAPAFQPIRIRVTVLNSPLTTTCTNSPASKPRAMAMSSRG